MFSWRVIFKAYRIANIAIGSYLFPLKLFTIFFVYEYRKEIQATLERLKRAESNLTAKERELMEREIKLIEREKTLEQQFKTVVRFPDI